MAQRKFIIDGGFKTDDASELLANLTMGGTIDMSSNKILNVDTPAAAGDAAPKSYVDAKLDLLVDAAPGALDTLNELAAAMGDDANFSATVTNSLALKSDITYVDAQITATRTYADTAETDAVAAAATDATTKADAAQANAQSFATNADLAVSAAWLAADTAQTTAINSAWAAGDAAVTTAAATDATTKADAANAAADATAVAADAVVTTAFVAADAVVTAAHIAADTAQTTSINTAWAAGDAAVTTAMQTYADTAETDAVATASADATTKANAAQSAAEATASADATAKVAALIDSAPGTLDTLNELAAALGDDANYAASVTSAITAGDSASVSTASADATTKANAGQAAAISTASSDATTKANAAQAAAQAYADANDANDNTTYTAGNGLTLGGTVFTMSGSYTGSFTATGDITAYSDESLKTNIQVIDGALGRVEAIRGVTFDRIEDGSTSTGVVAHELEAVLPEAVHTDENGLKSVAYGNITGLLIEAVKELSAQVAELKAK